MPCSVTAHCPFFSGGAPPHKCSIKTVLMAINVKRTDGVLGIAIRDGTRKTTPNSTQTFKFHLATLSSLVI